MSAGIIKCYRHRYIEQWRSALSELSRFMAKNVIQDLARDLNTGKVEQPDWRSSAELSLAIKSELGGDPQHGKFFCERSIVAADWALRLGVLDTGLAKNWHPRNVAIAARSGLYARWLLGGLLDRRALTGTVPQIIDWLHNRGHIKVIRSDDVATAEYLKAVRAALIGGDLDQARRLLEKHALKWHFKTQQDLYLRLLDQHPAISGELRLEFERFFDMIRHPDLGIHTTDVKDDGSRPLLQVADDIDLARLEVGMIRQMYLVNKSPDGPLDPTAVIAAVSA